MHLDSEQVDSGIGTIESHNEIPSRGPIVVRGVIADEAYPIA